MLTTRKGGLNFPDFIRGIPLIFSIAGLFIFSGCSESGPVALEKGARLIDEGNFSDAISKLDKAVTLLPKDAQAWNYLGLANHYAGNAAKAEQAYQQAFQVDRNLAVVKFNLGCLDFEQNNFPSAISELSSYTVLEPRKSEGWFKLGAAQLHHSLKLTGSEKMKTLDSARKCFDTSANIAPTPEVFNYLGIVETQRGRARDAVRFFNSALQKQPDYPPALLNAAVVYHTQLNDHRAALEKYRQFLASQPRSSRFQQVEEVARQLELELGKAGSTAPNSGVGTQKVAK